MVVAQSVNEDQMVGETHRRTPKSISTWEPTGSWRPLLNREKILTPVATSHSCQTNGLAVFSCLTPPPPPRVAKCCTQSLYQRTFFCFPPPSHIPALVNVLCCQNLSHLTQGSSEIPQEPTKQKLPQNWWFPAITRLPCLEFTPAPASPGSR